jgi:hypothetical protein
MLYMAICGAVPQDPEIKGQFRWQGTASAVATPRYPRAARLNRGTSASPTRRRRSRCSRGVAGPGRAWPGREGLAGQAWGPMAGKPLERSGGFAFWDCDYRNGCPRIAAAAGLADIWANRPSIFPPMALCQWPLHQSLYEWYFNYREIWQETQKRLSFGWRKSDQSFFPDHFDVASYRASAIGSSSRRSGRRLFCRRPIGKIAGRPGS